MPGEVVPAGRITIDVDGVWSYDGVEMTRRDIVRLLYRHLRPDSAGVWAIQMGRQRYPVEVEDTAYVVWALSWEPGEQGDAARLLLSDDSVEELDPRTLWMRNDGVPCCRVKSGEFEARLSRTSYYRLAERLEYDAVSDSYVLHLNRRAYPFHCA